jgi:hypothetical protein
MAHLAVAHACHEEKFKEDAIAQIAGSKKRVQFLGLVHFGFPFHVARPIAFLQQSGNVVRLEELGHHCQFVVGGAGIVPFLAQEKHRETLQVAAVDFFRVALRTGFLKLLQGHPVREIGFRLLACDWPIQVEELTAVLIQGSLGRFGILSYFNTERQTLEAMEVPFQSRLRCGRLLAYCLPAEPAMLIPRY